VREQESRGRGNAEASQKKSISPYTTKLFTFQQPEQSRNEVWRRENLKTANFQEKKRVHTGMAQETGKIGQVHCIPTPRSRVAGCRRVVVIRR